MHFADELAQRVSGGLGPVCVGLDPVWERLPESVRRAAGGQGAGPAARGGAMGEFGCAVVGAVAGRVPAVKVQSGCFERYGSAGVAAMERVMGQARDAGLLVILDAKRGDIGVTAEHYAAAMFEGQSPADAVTVSPYLGMDTLEPFVSRSGRGVFVLVRTSNAGSGWLQGEELSAGGTVAHAVARGVAQLGAQPGRIGASGLSCVGAVVGATKAAEAESLRLAMPAQVFLVPGYGAQGGTAQDVQRMVRPQRTGAHDAGVLVTASRSVIYAYEGADVGGGGGAGESGGWQGAVRDAAARLSAEVMGVVGC